jgi:GMP synthase (glutamine-hydrolysing)
VGVQGDSRTYRSALALASLPSDWHLPTELINRHSEINRVVAVAATHTPVAGLRSFPATITDERLERLRHADAIVRRLSHESGFDKTIWQFPVVLLPIGTLDRPDSVVLRPIDSVDGMTAEAVRMPEALLEQICKELLETEGVSTVFYDLTHKPPATIEWE